MAAPICLSVKRSSDTTREQNEPKQRSSRMEDARDRSMKSVEKVPSFNIVVGGLQGTLGLCRRPAAG